MGNAAEIELTERQRAILRRVVEEYVVTGQPVGSKTLVARARLRVSPSTVRSELSELEGLGLLAHPHTSAGRVPTEAGYRFYADSLLDRLEPNPGPFPLDLTVAESEVESALEATTEMLSELTRLLALVSAPPLETTTVRHAEVLLLQPQIIMAVVITSSGDVTKRVYTFDEPVDPGLARWAGQYLNDAVAGLRLGTRLLRQRFEDPSLSERERTFLGTLRSAFTELGENRRGLYVGGAAGLLENAGAEELETYQQLLEFLEKRATMLQVVSRALDPRGPFVRVGLELDHPALAKLSLVGAGYGLANRTLGVVSLLGPVRMDYEQAIHSVRGAANELSKFVAEIYEDN
ncbi:MAG: heat-inducible transcriptional repressor HrcA [Actinomycetota bacterium]|nr:heat-inducible transcriptional repressor HrcA [Actinomycetota bacterium]